MAKADQQNELDRLEKLLAAHKRIITEMMSLTENLQAAIQLARRNKIPGVEHEDEIPTPSVA